MDFARCYGCKKLVWTSDHYHEKHGMECPLCGSTWRHPVVKMTLGTRMWVLRNYLREFIEINPWYDWAAPWNFAKAVWIGLHPQPIKEIADRKAAEKAALEAAEKAALA